MKRYIWALMFGLDVLLAVHQCIVQYSLAFFSVCRTDNYISSGNGRRKDASFFQYASFNLLAFSIVRAPATCNHFQRESFPHHIAKMKMPPVAQSYICVMALDHQMLMMLSKDSIQQQSFFLFFFTVYGFATYRWIIYEACGSDSWHARRKNRSSQSRNGWYSICIHFLRWI